MDSNSSNAVTAGGPVVTLTTAFVAIISNPIPLLQNILALISITVGIFTLINMARKWRAGR